MSINAYLKIKGIDGVSPVLDEQKLVNIESYEHSLANPVGTRGSAGPTTGLRRGCCDHGLFIVQRHTDSVSPAFFRACAGSVILEGVACHVMRSDFDSLKQEHQFKPHLSIFMSDVVIASFRYLGGPMTPMEEIGFCYRSIDWVLGAVDPDDHTAAGEFEAGWDGTKNKVGLDDKLSSLKKTIGIKKAGLL